MTSGQRGSARLEAIERRKRELLKGIVACYETIDIGRKKIERLDEEKRSLTHTER